MLHKLTSTRRIFLLSNDNVTLYLMFTVFFPCGTFEPPSLTVTARSLSLTFWTSCRKPHFFPRIKQAVRCGAARRSVYRGIGECRHRHRVADVTPPSSPRPLCRSHRIAPSYHASSPRRSTFQFRD